MPVIPNLKLYLSAMALLVAFGVGWHFSALTSQHKLESALKSQESLLIGQCNDSKAITEKVDHDNQAKISDLTKRVAAYRMRKPSACLSIANSASGSNGSAGAGFVGEDALVDFAADAEKYRLTLVACQDFIRAERQ